MAFHSGTVVFIGKPNVGKSTIINALVGKKVSIVSSKPQTTRRRAMGIVQGKDFQFGIIDTPGFHEPTTRLGRAMVEQARSAIADVDLVAVVCDVSKDPEDLDRGISRLLEAGSSAGFQPVILCLNKMDRLQPQHVASRVEAFTKLFKSEDYMLTAANKNQNLDKLAKVIAERLPERPALFPEDEFTDQPARFMVAELIREKVLNLTRQEVPHATAVRIDQWDETDPKLLRIAASILVERDGQKAIVIGKHGALIKQIGTDARAEIEELLGLHVFLDLHVAVREDWRMSQSMLKDLEYT